MIGIGMMGSTLAEALLASGHRVTVWNRTASKCGALAEAGASVAASVSDAAAQAQVIVVCVTDHDASVSLLLSDEVADALRGRLLVQRSTAMNAAHERDRNSQVSDRAALYAEAPRDFRQPNKRHVTQIENYVTGYIGGNVTGYIGGKMTKESMPFEAILDEVYQGEVIGEAFFNTLLPRFKSPEQQYKLGSLLQLETEFKAKVRPIAIAHGLDPVEREESRQKGQDFADSLEGETWEEVMASFAAIMTPLVARYKEMGAAVPSDYKEFGAQLIAHEKSVGDFAKLEAAGEINSSINDVVEQLIYPLPSPKEDSS